MGNIVQRSGSWHKFTRSNIHVSFCRKTNLQTHCSAATNKHKLQLVKVDSLIYDFFFCSSWLLLNLPKNLQVLLCSFNNTGPGLNHLFSLESKIYSEKAKLQCVESYFVSLLEHHVPVEFPCLKKCYISASSRI